MPISITKPTVGGSNGAWGPILDTALDSLANVIPGWNLKDPTFGAKGDTVQIFDGAITASTAALSSASTTFVPADVGKVVQVLGAGSGGAALNTTISSVSAGVATLAANAGTTVTAAQVTYGTDDYAAVCAWAATGGALYAPPGIYLINGGTPGQTVRPRITGSGSTLQGAGRDLTVFMSTLLYDGTNNNIDLFVIGQTTASIPLGLDGSQTSNVSVDGATFQFSAPATARGSANNTLRVSRVNNFRISNYRIKYGTFGLLFNRAKGFWVSGGEISNTFADGFQGNNGSDTADMTLQDGFIYGNWVHDTGDDGIAVGGTQDGGVNRTQPKNIHIYDNTVENISGGAGIAVYGVDGFTVHDNVIYDPATAFIRNVLQASSSQFPSRNGRIHHNFGFSDQTPSAGAISGNHSLILGDLNSTLTGSELSVPFQQNIYVDHNTFIASDRSGIWCQPNASITSAMWLANIHITDNDFVYTGSTSSTLDLRPFNVQFINGLDFESNRFAGFPSRGKLDQFMIRRFNGNKFEECCSDSTYATQDMIDIGQASTSTDTIEEFANNTFRKSSGTVNRLLNFKATSTGGAFRAANNYYFTTGATITTVAFNFATPTTVPNADPDVNGHISSAILPVGPQAAALLRRTASTPAQTETFSRVGTVVSNVTSVLTSQNQLFVAVPVTKGMVLSKIGFWSGGTAAGTPVNQFFGLWSAALGQLGVTNDDTTTAWAANTEKVLTLATPYTVTADGYLYLSIMVNATTTPSLLGVGSTSNINAASPVLVFRDSAHTVTTPGSAPSTATNSSSTGAYPYAWIG